MMNLNRRYIAAGVAVAAVGGVAPFVTAFGSQSTDDGTTETEPAQSEPATAKTDVVRRETLARTSEHNADLGFGESRTLMARGEGTITWLPLKGALIKPGDVLWEIDRKPVILLQGELPMYRELSTKAKKGDDIQQLERYLIEAGFGPDGWEADSTFNARTKAAVKEFQTEHGMTVDGSLGPAEVVVGPEVWRVAGTAHTGDDANSGPILTVTSSTATVTMSASSRQLTTFRESPEVSVVLSDGRELSATLDEVETTPADEDGAFGYTVGYTINDEVTEAQPVKVKIAKVLAADALTVPVDALIALAGGGYAIEIQTGDDVELRGVDVIDFEDTRVAITGEISEGDVVVVLL